jgi:undecaprenyl-diphosphatase
VKRSLIVGTTLATAVFIVLAIVTSMNATDGVNTSVESAVYGIRADWLTAVMRSMTFLGEWYSLGPAAILILLVPRWRTVAIPAVASLAVSAVLNIVLKTLFAVPRPTGHRLIEESGFGFPSGHAQSSAGFVGVLVVAALRAGFRAVYRHLVAVLAWAFILLVGLSRVYLGVHSPVDVLAGFALGAAGAWLVVALFDWFARGRFGRSRLARGRVRTHDSASAA